MGSFAEDIIKMNNNGFLLEGFIDGLYQELKNINCP